MAIRNQFPDERGQTDNGRYATGGGRQAPPQQGIYRPQAQRDAASRQMPDDRRRRDEPAPQPRREPPQQAYPTQQVERPKRELILFSVILFGIPLIGFIGLFFQPFLWGLSIVSLICLVALLFCQCFTKNVRTIISVILLVLTVLGAVAASEMTPKQNNYPQFASLDPTDTYNTDDQTSNNPAFVGFGVTPTATAPLDGLGDAGDGQQDETGLQGGVDGGGGDGVAGTFLEGEVGTQEAPPMNDAIAGAQTVLEAYLTQWKDRNFEEMVKYTTNTWRASQSAPQQQLYWNHNWWILNSWMLSTQTTSPTSDSVTFKVITDLSKSNSTKEPAKMEYNAIVFRESGGWFVDPDSLRNGIAIVEATPEPQTAEGAATTGTEAGATTTTDTGIPSNAVLWYNSKGGKYYHAQEQCSTIDPQYYKDMKSFTYGELGESDFKKLIACPKCGAPSRP